MTGLQQKNLVLRLAGATMIGMPLLASIIDRFSESLDMSERLLGGTNILLQIGVGGLSGLVLGMIAQWIVDREFMDSVNTRYARLIGNLRLNTSEIVFISICAGVGEEILFRGALQHFWGIVITAVFFVAIHGYLSFRDWRISVYGVFMTGAICLLGYYTEVIGIWSAVLAHTVIDVYLLMRLKSDPPEDENDDALLFEEENIDV